MGLMDSARRIVDNNVHAQVDMFAKGFDLDSNTALDIIYPIAPVVGQAADTVTTLMGLNRGYEEGNPFVKNVVRNAPLFVALKLGTGAAMGYAVHRLQENGHKNFAKVVSGLGFLVGAAPAISNIMLIKEKRR